MISLSEIEKFYPGELRAFRRNMLREYLQYKILQAIFDSPYAGKLSFLGGTELRIVHGNTRFSEDLDFDNFGLTKEEFDGLSDFVRRRLELDGYAVEIRNVFKGAYRCYIRLPKLLFDNGLSGYEEEKILIQIDTMPHHVAYSPDRTLLNKFDVFTEIRTTPVDIILAQKIYAIFNRKTKKGRDFFDVVFLLSLVKPNYVYLKEKMEIEEGGKLKEKLLEICKTLDFKALAEDVTPFLFRSEDAKKVLWFERYIRSVEL